MVTSVRLETYLAELEKALGPIPISDKAEIILEIKSHVLDAQERDNTQTIENILSSLGEPQQVASKYLLERGLKLQKPPKHPVIKWLVLGFLGTVLMIILAIFILIWKFTPIFNIDGKTGNVNIMGGLIKIDNFTSNLEASFTGNKKIDRNKIKNISVDFINASFEFKTSKNSFIEWECIGDTKYQENENTYLEQDSDTLSFKFKNSMGVRCDFKIPSDVKLITNGINGKIGIAKPAYNVDMTVVNGVIGISPDDNLKYDYDFSSKNFFAKQTIDSFVSSKSKDAYKIKIKASNGTIKRY